MSGAWAAVERRCWLRVGPRSVRAPSADPHQPLSVRDLLLSLSSPADRAAADDSDRTCRRRRQALQVSPALRARVGRARDRARRSPPGRATGNARSSCTGSLAGSVPGSCSSSSIGLPPACAPLVLVARACVCVCVCGTNRMERPSPTPSRVCYFVLGFASLIHSLTSGKTTAPRFGGLPNRPACGAHNTAATNILAIWQIILHETDNDEQ